MLEMCLHVSILGEQQVDAKRAHAFCMQVHA